MSRKLTSTDILDYSGLTAGALNCRTDAIYILEFTQYHFCCMKSDYFNRIKTQLLSP